MNSLHDVSRFVSQVKHKLAVQSGKSHYWIALVTAYFGSKILAVSALADATSDFTTVTGSPNGNASDILPQYLASFIPMFTKIAAVILVIAMIVCGMKLGYSTITGDPRARMGSLTGLIFICVGAIVVIHAKQLVAAVAGFQPSYGN